MAEVAATARLRAEDRARMARDDRLRQQWASGLREWNDESMARAEARRRQRAREEQERQDRERERIRALHAGYEAVIPERPGYYVYRLWDADGRCLYVGMVGTNGPRDLRKRLAEHRRTKPWWPEVARTDVRELATYPDADSEEVRQQWGFSPAYVAIYGHVGPEVASG